MRRSFSKHATVFLTLVLQGPVLAEETNPPMAKPDRAEVAKKIEIERDADLGKPLVSWRRPSKDSEGRQAVDVLEQFLVHVRDGELGKAKALCRFTVFADDKEERERKLAASEALFSDFARELQQATKYTLGATVKQKSVYWNMRVVAEGVEKQPWPYRVNFSFENKTWRILVHDLVARYREDTGCSGC